MDFINSILDGTLTTSATFFILGVIGLVLLILATVLDGIFDGLSLGDGPISLVSISAFLAMFGFSAFVAMYAGANMTMAILVGSLTGLAGAVGAWTAMRFFKNSESSVSYSVNTLVGEQANVTIEIDPGKLGEVSILFSGMRNYLAAMSDSDITLRTGSTVYIESILNDDMVKVSTTPVPKPAPVEPETKKKKKGAN